MDTCTKQQTRKRGESKYEFDRCENCVGKPERNYCGDCRRTLQRMRDLASRDRRNPGRHRKATTRGESQYDFGRCEECIGKTIKQLCDECRRSYYKITKTEYNSPEHQGHARNSKYRVERCVECADKPQRQLCPECRKQLSALRPKSRNRTSKATGVKRGPKPGTPSPLKGRTRIDAPRCGDCEYKGVHELCQVCRSAYHTAKYRGHNGPFTPHKERNFCSRGRTRFQHHRCDKCKGKATREFCDQCKNSYKRAVAQDHYQPSGRPSAPRVSRADFNPCIKCKGKRIVDFCKLCKRKYRQYSGATHRHRAKILGRICEHGLGCVPNNPTLAERQGWKCQCGANLKKPGFT